MTDDIDKDAPRVVNVVNMRTPRNESAALAEKLKRDLEPNMDIARTIARYRRAAFLAYVAEGFTEAQALELCCK